MFISVTKISLKNIFFIVRFMRHNAKIFKQIGEAKGNLSFATSIQNPLVYWTFTTWDSKESMMQFRNNGAHKDAMKEVRNITKEAISGHWESEQKPSWKEAKVGMMENISSRY